MKILFTGLWIVIIKGMLSTGNVETDKCCKLLRRSHKCFHQQSGSRLWLGDREWDHWPPELPSLSIYLHHILESFVGKQESNWNDFLNARCTEKRINLDLKWVHALHQNNDTNWQNEGSESVDVRQQIKLLLSKCNRLGICGYGFTKPSPEHDCLKATLTLIFH